MNNQELINEISNSIIERIFNPEAVWTALVLLGNTDTTIEDAEKICKIAIEVYTRKRD